jgi:SAM-dependent methyltransferase
MAELTEISVDIEAYATGSRGAGLPVMLGLGCGAKKAPGAFGIDVGALPGVDLVRDLEETPYPLPETCADALHLNHVLEHFEDPLRVLEEVWRLARPTRVYIRTPHYSGIYARIDPTYRHALSAASFHSLMGSYDEVRSLAIQYAIAGGAAEYDSLPGAEPYKFHWTRGVRTLVRLELHPPGVRGVVCRGGAAASGRIRRTARRLAGDALTRWGVSRGWVGVRQALSAAARWRHREALRIERGKTRLRLVWGI